MSITSFAQQEENIIRVVGDSLIGKTINSESVREVHGNVVITQGAVRITCNKAVQYLARNEAELIGKVVVTQDSITILTDLGYYYGDSKTAFSKSGVAFSDGHINLKSKNGYYYFDEKKAYFYENVQLKDSISTLNADKLTYYDDEDKTIAVGRIIVKDTSTTIYADSLIHFRNNRITYGFNNVRVFNPSDHLLILGNNLEDYQEKKYSKIFGDSYLIKVDTTSSGALDTLVISAKLMEAYNDSIKRMIATDSVKIVRSGFASLNNFTIYYQDENRLYTLRRDTDRLQPVLWNENTQLMGDTVNIFLKDNRLDEINIVSNASIVSQNPDYSLRFDQISGKTIKMLFGSDGLEKTEVSGNVLSIYYLYEENEPNGLLKSSSEKAIIHFKENSLADVRLYGSPVSEYHPENIILSKEKDFTLPAFILIKNKPTKKSLLSNTKLLSSILEIMGEYGK